jgi:transposase-like protein
MARFLSDHKAQEWRRRLIRFEKSRHTISEFCRQEGFSPHSFYLWRKRLAEQPAAQPPDAFRPVRVLPAGGVSVQLPGGTQLVVPTADAQSLQLVIETLARIDADRLGDACPC